MLRDYQRAAIDMTFEWFGDNEGNACIVLPTGSGKSHVIAEICKETIQTWSDTKILMLTHQKELIEQDAQKLRDHWPEVPLGIYSASIGKRELDTITFAGIQSVRKRADEIGEIDLVLIDEAHLVSHKAEGSYRTFIEELRVINPWLRVIGLTATPYRLGHGMITDAPALFQGLIEPTSIEALQSAGHLAYLRSKVTREKLSAEGVGKRGGEYIPKELNAIVDIHTTSVAVVEEVISLATERKAWLFFCSGVEHAQHVKDILIDHGIPAECVTGKTPKAEREDILARFKSGELRAVTNANVLTTGFDYPDIDLVVMMRPTMSPGLYMQMAGRGLRKKTHGGDCLVLDFAGVVEMHGPITDVTPPSKKGEGTGVAPSRICPNCDEILPLSCKVCTNCGEVLIDLKVQEWWLRGDDINGRLGNEIEIRDWNWALHTSGVTGNSMIKVTYYPVDLSHPLNREYFAIHNGGRAEAFALRSLFSIARSTGINLIECTDDMDICNVLNRQGRPPTSLTYKKEGKFTRILNKTWAKEIFDEA